MWWAPNVGWAGVADGRGQSWLILGKFKIQINPINLTFPGGENLWCNHICSTPSAKVFLYFCYQRISKKTWKHDIWIHRRNISTSQYMNLEAGKVALYVIDICQNCSSVFLQFRDWYLSKVQFSWEQCHLCGGDAPYLQFYAFQMTSQQMLIPKQFIAQFSRLFSRRLFVL